MRTTIDRAGRMVIPKALRDAVGIVSGEVELSIEGTAVRVEPVVGEGLIEEAGRLVIPGTGVPVDDDTVRGLREADRR